MICVKDISFGYKKEKILYDVSFTLNDGEVLGVVGPNGSGKSTLLRVVSGIAKSWTGEVILNGNELAKMKRRVVARTIAMLPQHVGIVFPYSVSEIVLMGRYPYLGGLGFETEEDIEIATHAMSLTDVYKFKDRYIAELSGGEVQRVMIARALAQGTEYLFLDEPTSYLDINHQIEICLLIKKLNQENGIAVLFVSHDLNLASQFCDRIVILSMGKIFKIGTPGEVLTEDSLKEVYGCNVMVDENPMTGRPRVTPMPV
ncbi:MAG: heme ABC transporter ATP-binding protein [Thermodesulfobacteriota bacterium]|nr:heme ABC transporter ATP-binding protein [Thermodesulfobacteriota bacterium]